MAHRGTRVIYIVGNHDEMLREYAGLSFGGITIHNEAIHETRDGRRLLVTHGDAFDGIVLYAKWLAFLGDWSYRTLLMLNTLLNRARRRMGLGYWSLSAFLKVKVKNALQFIERFEEAVAEEARRRGADGVICGHIHKAEMRQIGDILYVNDGDWVESCTALAEHEDGRLEIIEWAKERSWSMINRASGADRSSESPTEALGEAAVA
jgi:UDP-2,3-diacylglucosamine pyrophosphatase LpxH